jgi:GNAT superfamily N-acetyltransferase
VAGGRVAGVLVTQTLSHAYRAAVAAPSVGPAGAPPGPRQLVMDTSAAVPARLGVAQVWVHPDFRGGGVATALLDAALSHAVYAARLTAEQLAFSAPTAAGEGLARAYLRRARGAQAGGAVDEEPALLVYA